MKIKIFKTTSEALEAWFEISRILDFPGAITEIVTASSRTVEDDWEIMRVGISNHPNSSDFISATFAFKRDLELGTDMQLAQVSIAVTDNQSTFYSVGATTREWSRAFLVEYPVNYEEPYFHPPEVSLVDFRKAFGPGTGSKRALKHYFLTGKLPERD